MTRLVQISIVRNEQDVIEANLRHHRNLGVAAAAVIDNGSSDGTPEILEDLARRMDLVVIRKDCIAKHDLSWREELLSVARDVLQGDWIVPVDADEFWMPPGGDLHTVLDDSVGVLEARRDNVLPGAGIDQEDLGDFRHSVLRVRQPFPVQAWKAFATGADDCVPDHPILMSEIRPKVLCRLEGLIELGYGFHEARHAEGTRKLPDSCRLLHFPVRSFEQFRAKVQAHARSHGLAWHNEDPTRSWHLKYWNRLRNEGRLEAEYRSFFLPRERRLTFHQLGVLDVLVPHPLAVEAPMAAPREMTAEF
ncbi:MAG: glycosyltransferase family 2 protein [Thermoanaerobaculia bacterium]|nr:glycosyltransferase family 2 protein [Thermoanaerobaculia bacterium]